jgi:hypothetical protein
MEEVKNILSQDWTHTRRFRECVDGCQLYGIDRMEMSQQIPHTLRAHSRNVRQARAFHPFASLLPMKTHSKTVGLIPESTKQRNSQLISFTLQRLTFTRKEHFFPLLCEGANI